MTIAASVLESYKQRLWPLTVASGVNGGFLHTLDIFGGDWEKWLERNDFRAPGVLLHYTGSSPIVLDAAQRGHSRRVQIDLILFNDSKRGITERVAGDPKAGGTLGIWEMEDMIIPLLVGFQPTVSGCAHARCKFVQVKGSQEVQVKEGITVWIIRTEVETSAVLTA